MSYLYDFGLSQDDYRVEEAALTLTGGKVLCIASGGDVPLSLLAKYPVRVKAVDVSENQLRLCRLKLAAATVLDPGEAAAFLGFTDTGVQRREQYFGAIETSLPNGDRKFWQSNQMVIGSGVINRSRFEKYLSRFCQVARTIMGKRHVQALLECNSTGQQLELFDRHLDKKAMRLLFRLAFSPTFYRKRGLDPRGLQHAQADLPKKFYNKFRDFFTKTPARENLYLQYYMLGSVQCNEALPVYLQDAHNDQFRKRVQDIEFTNQSAGKVISASYKDEYSGVCLSNIGDWLDVESMDQILIQLDRITDADSAIVIRYIHRNPLSGNEGLIKDFRVDPHFDKLSGMIDRFPFYNNLRLIRNQPA